MFRPESGPSIAVGDPEWRAGSLFFHFIYELISFYMDIETFLSYTYSKPKALFTQQLASERHEPAQRRMECSARVPQPKALRHGGWRESEVHADDTAAFGGKPGGSYDHRQHKAQRSLLLRQGAQHGNKGSRHRGRLHGKD